MYKDVYEWKIIIERWSAFSAVGSIEYVYFTGTYDMVCNECARINKSAYARAIDFVKVGEMQ